MLEIFKTINEELVKLDSFEEGAWVNLTNPTEAEINYVCEKLGAEPDFVRAALDEEERARIDYENGQTLIIVDIPIIEKDDKIDLYSTIPLGIIVLKECILTVCLKENSLVNYFIKNRIKAFYTHYKTRFILQLLHRNATLYLNHLRHIDRLSSKIEEDLHKSMKNKELIQLLKLEKSLVYFSTSLKANELVLEKMLKLDYIKKYPEDTDLLEDVIIENKQAIEMANIYTSILSGTMDAFASVISNNVNIVMKFLTSVTIVMAIPTIVSSIYGMNVPLPLQNSRFAFPLVILITLMLTGFATYFLARKKMF